MDYPSNNKSVPNEPKKEREKRITTPVIEGKVIQRKKTIPQRFRAVMISGDPKVSLRDSMDQVFIPDFKRAILNTMKNTLDRIFLGDGIPARRDMIQTATGMVTRVAYESARGTFQGQSQQRNAPAPRALTWQQRATHSFDNIILAQREDAIQVITDLQTCIENYGQARVTDLYDAIGVTSDYTDEAWGWLDLSQAGYRPESEGYLLRLPKPEPLN